MLDCGCGQPSPSQAGSSLDTKNSNSIAYPTTLSDLTLERSHQFTGAIAQPDLPQLKPAQTLEDLQSQQIIPATTNRFSTNVSETPIQPLFLPPITGCVLGVEFVTLQDQSSIVQNSDSAAVTWTVENRACSTTFAPNSVRVRFWRSNDNVFDSTIDRQIGTDASPTWNTGTINPGDIYTQQNTISFGSEGPPPLSVCNN